MKNLPKNYEIIQILEDCQKNLKNGQDVNQIAF